MRVKVLVASLAAAVLAGGMGWQFVLKDQVAFAGLGAAYGAKMVCSCQHVAGRAFATCQNEFTEDLSPFSFEETQMSGQPAVRVSAILGLVSRTAAYEPDRGCAVVD